MTEICDQVMAGLSCFLWNGANCSVHDMASLLSDSWLSDFHIDYFLKKISHHYCSAYGAEAFNPLVLLPISNIGSIVLAYKGSVHYVSAAEKSKNLLEVKTGLSLAGLTVL